MKPCESRFSFLTFLFNGIHPSRSGDLCYAESSLVDYRQMIKEYAIREINLLLWVSFTAITILLLRKLVKLFRLWVKGSRIPGPPCPSFYGHSELFNGKNPQENLSGLLLKSHVRYGSIVKLWLGPSQLLVSVKDPVLIQDMLLKAADKSPLTGRTYRLAFGKSSFFAASFDKVEKQRESLIGELNGKLLERANLMTGTVIECVMERLQAIMTRRTLDCVTVAEHMAFAIMGGTFFGDAFFTWSKATVYEDILMRIAKDACFWASYSVTPFWERGYLKYHHLCARLKCLTEDIVQQCRKNYKLLCQQNCHNEFVGAEEKAAPVAPSAAGALMPENFNTGQPNGNLNVQEACGNVMGMMFHGCLTTAGLIGNILARLVMHPELQDMIYSEIMAVRKVSRKQKQEDIKEMPLLLATIYESARLLPTGPLLQRCSIRHDLKLENGVTLPAGAILIAPIQLVQMDEFIWGSDASQFNPYRFLSKAETRPDYLTPIKGVTPKMFKDAGERPYILSDPNENAAFLSFGSGIRACVGQKFTVLGVAAVLASLLESYELKLEGGSSADPKPLMNNCILQLLPSPKITLVRRNS
ncbi:hypothetical protein Ancab_034633 [Ancistrocladus abbreviatus]